MGDFRDHPENINRKGRPKKGQTLTDILTKLGDIKDIDFKEKKIKKKEAIAIKIWNMALAGDLTAIRYIFDRIDGTVIQKTQALEKEIIRVEVGE